MTKPNFFHKISNGISSINKAFSTALSIEHESYSATEVKAALQYIMQSTQYNTYFEKEDRLNHIKSLANEQFHKNINMGEFKSIIDKMIKGNGSTTKWTFNVTEELSEIGQNFIKHRQSIDNTSGFKSNEEILETYANSLERNIAKISPDLAQHLQDVDIKEEKKFLQNEEETKPSTENVLRIH